MPLFCFSVDYKTFNILDDDFVREGLKLFSNWPTFPQLYVKGELVGGLDVVLELQEKQELMNYLNPAVPPQQQSFDYFRAF